MGKNFDDAVVMRDIALRKLWAEGSFAKIGDTPYLSWRGDGLSMAFRTPFQALPPVSTKTVFRMLETRMISGGENRDYGLDVWANDLGKVLNIEWDADGRTELVGFRRGSWGEHC